MSKLTGKVAVVTGASKGIGAAIAKSLAAEGASVVVNYASSKAGADAVVAAIAAAGGKAVAVAATFPRPPRRRALSTRPSTNYGRLDILVNNSGVYEFAPIEGITEERSTGCSTSTCSAFCSPRRRRSSTWARAASIINIGSGITRLTPPARRCTRRPRARSTRSPACSPRNWAARKIRVNSINPGIVETEGTHSRRRHRLRLREEPGRPDPAGPRRPAGRHRLRCRLPGLGRFGVAHRRADHHERRPLIRPRGGCGIAQSRTAIETTR